MTHRTKHLGALGLIEREKGVKDRRNVVCALTKEGVAYTEGLCTACCSKIKAGQPLARVDAGRMCRYVDAMGSITCRAGDLVLLGVLSAGNEGSTVTSLVDLLGLLQPTVSMSVSSLDEEGLVERKGGIGEAGRSSLVVLTEEGVRRSQALREQIEALVVRRRSRSSN